MRRPPARGLAYGATTRCRATDPVLIWCRYRAWPGISWS